MKKLQVGSGNSQCSNIVVYPPAYPKTASEVIRLLKVALDAAERKSDQKFDQKEFAQLIGAPKSTVHDWYYGQLPKPIRYFLCAMERLSETQRLAVLRKLCREHLTLDHPRLCHDLQAVTFLRSLISQSRGLTILTGMDAPRNFLFTALGNTACQILHLRFIAGFDFHTPDTFVPVPGVHYYPKKPADFERLNQLESS